ncbi:hypothetical protein D3C87_189920 [compost metagenome]
MNLAHKLIIACIMLILPLQSMAQEKQNLRLYNDKTKAYDSLSFVKINKAWVSESCAKKSTCSALTALKKKVTIKPNESGFFGNPGSAYCLSQGGVARILKDAKNSEYDYCLFPDGSMIDSWNMYYAHHEK